MDLSAILTAYPRLGVCRLSIGRLWAASLFALVFTLFSFGQAPPSNPQAMGGGNSTAGAHAAIHDAENRPITAGGFVNSGPVVFEDITRSRVSTNGITRWAHPRRNSSSRLMAPASALLDYDNDGWLDIYLVNGSTYDALQRQASRHPMRRSSTTIMTALSPTWPPRPVSPTTAGDSALPSAITTTTAGLIFTSATTARIGSTTTITTAPLPTSRKRPVSRSATGQPEQPSATTTATAGSISSFPATFTTT